MVKIIHLLLIVCVISTTLRAESSCEEDLKTLFPLAENWVSFTEDFNNNFKTQIDFSSKKNPLILNYYILDRSGIKIFKDKITIPIKNNKNYKLQIAIGSGIFLVGLTAGLIINK